MSQSKLPTFLIIGAMKSGTSSLHQYLGKHTEIFTSEVKEINFFNKNFEKGVSWYQEHFNGYKVKHYGESSQSYSRAHLFKNFSIPERIFKVAPNVKLIYILRDPVERIISHYYETKSLGYNPPEDFVSHIIKHPNNNWVKTSSYYWQLGKYLPYFSKDQFLIITMEALKNDKLRTLNKVFAFLDVEQMNDMSRFDFVRNTRSEKKVQSLLFKSIYNKTLSGLLSTNLKLKIKQSWIGKKLFQSEVKKIEFTEQDKSKLRELLSDDVANLKNFTGYSFDEWSF